MTKIKNMSRCLVSAILLLGGLAANAQQYTAVPFVLGSGLILSNNTTTLYGYTNVWYIDPQSIMRSSFSTNVIYPVYYDYTLTNRIANRDLAGIVYYTNAQNTIWNGTANVGATNAPQWGYAWQDVPTWADRNGISGSGSLLTIGVALAGPSVSSTNTVTFTFATLEPAPIGAVPVPQIPPGASVGPGSSGGAGYGASSGYVMNQAATTNSLFTFSCTNNGLSGCVFHTNPPAAFVQGAGAIRLVSVITSNAGTPTNNFLNGVWLEGFQP